MEDTSYVECSTLEIKEKGKKFLVLRVYVGSVDENFGLHYSVEWLTMLAFYVWILGLVHIRVLIYWVLSCEKSMILLIVWLLGGLWKKERRKENF